MQRNSAMTSAQARETIDRLSAQTASLHRHHVAPEALVAEYNESLAGFVPRDKMALFFIGKGRYVGDTTRPGSFVEGGLFRHLLERARIDFDVLLDERGQQAPYR